MFKKILLFMCFLLALPLLAKVEASLDLDKAIAGDELRLSLIIEGKPEVAPSFPKMENIRLLGTSQGYNSQYVNGVVNTHTTIVYTFTATKEGSYDFDPFVVTIGGKKFESNPVHFEIRQPSSEASPDGKENDQDKGPANFIERELSKKTVYVGEALMLTTKFLHQTPINNVGYDPFKSDDFRSILFDGQQKKEYRGKDLFEMVIFKRVMIPLKSGNFSLGADRLQAHFVVPRQKEARDDDVFSHFFGRSRYEVIRKVLATDPNSIEVLPVPLQGRPKDYQSLVGDFRVVAELSTKELKVGETSTLTITIRGHGLLDGAKAPKLDLPSSVKVYADKPSLEERKDAVKGLYSQRVFKYALVPTKQGKLNLGTFHESYFDPKEKTFKSLKADLGELSVAAGDTKTPPVVASSPVVSSNKKAVEKAANDLIDLKRDKSLLLATRDSWFASLLYYLSVFLVLIGVLLKLAKKMHWLQPKMTLEKKKKIAYSNYKKERKELDSLMSKGDIKHLADKYSALLRGYLGYKFGLNPESLTTLDLQRSLEQETLAPELKEEIIKVMKIMDRVSFGYESSDQSSHEKNIKAIDQLVKKVESHV